ncbi:hypothetical protein Q0F99_17875 [Rathayibacter oskolensis]|uniref:hypothetical protein n=1 Tax=Rathayibacter oskolensis TaxID=1891671 RepID=UPI00265E5699|nr:hypothetical protein [Rathayibacter oskolensis]WKK71295.1 hypothetical protein Q0F99_17875 [Rathayibacter oskolensis]
MTGIVRTVVAWRTLALDARRSAGLWTVIRRATSPWSPISTRPVRLPGLTVDAALISNARAAVERAAAAARESLRTPASRPGWSSAI